MVVATRAATCLGNNKSLNQRPVWRRLTVWDTENSKTFLRFCSLSRRPTLWNVIFVAHLTLNGVYCRPFWVEREIFGGWPPHKSFHPSKRNVRGGAAANEKTTRIVGEIQMSSIWIENCRLGAQKARRVSRPTAQSDHFSRLIKIFPEIVLSTDWKRIRSEPKGPESR